MITGQKLWDMYFKMNTDKIITTKELNELGLSLYDISKLIKDKKIERVKRGYFKVAPFNELIGNDSCFLCDITRAKKYAEDKNKIIIPSNEDLNLVAKKYHEIENGKLVVLLEPMSQEKRHIIHYIVRGYPDLSSFTLNSEDPNKKYIVIKKRNLKLISNMSELIKQGNVAYTNNRFEEFFNCYNLVLTSGTTKSFVYAKLGLAYVKTHNYDNAILYLTIATLISKENNEKYDYSNLIYNLKLKSNDSYELNQSVQSSISTIEAYGIENLAELSRYISDNNLNVTEAWKKLGLSEEQINIVRLIYARDYYYRGIFNKGDQFFKAYEKSSEKSEYTKLLAKEIRTNRRFYQNRQNEMPLALSLRLKP